MAEKQKVSVSQAAELLGVTPATLRGWTNRGLVTCTRTLGGRGHRRFSIKEISRIQDAMREKGKAQWMREREW